MDKHMKLCIIGDPHFKSEYPYSELIKDGRKEERFNVESEIYKASQDCDSIILLGDSLDKRHNHSTVIKEFIEFLDGFGDKDVYILSGNHETYEGNKTAIDFLKGVRRNWIVITPTDGVFYDKQTKLGFVPYFTNAALGVSTKEEASENLMKMIEEHSYDAIFAHHMISETFNTDGVNEIVLDKNRLEAVSKLVVAGHIHSPRVHGRTLLTGSIFSHETGDHTKSVWSIDTEEGTFTEIPLPIRPIFKATNPTTEELDLLPERSIVKATLTEKGQDIEKIKIKLMSFDGHILVENYPDERKRMHVEKGQTIDLSIPALLVEYAKAKNKDPERLRQAFKIVSEA